MKILMTNDALKARGGSESYLQTVSTELRKLGHDVSFFSPHCGGVADGLRADGFAVHEDVAEIPDDVDVIHGQHSSAVGLVRTRLPSTPLVFVCHSWLINAVEDPVAELAPSAVVAFNDFTLRRMRAHLATVGVPVHRLTQPVAVSVGDGQRVPVSPVPTRAVAVSRRMITLPGRLEAACAQHGIDFTWIGGPGNEAADARHAMFTADIVIAMGRTALEAMAAARPVLVLDESVNGGWITAESYASLEADGFTGYQSPTGEADLVRLLEGYDDKLGNLGRHLVARHHLAQHHAARLVEIYAEVAGIPAADRVAARDAETVALLSADRFSLEQRLLRAEWRAAAAERDIDAVKHARELLLQELEMSREHVGNLEAELELVRSQRDRSRLRRQKAAARLAAAEEERDRALEQLAALRAARGVDIAGAQPSEGAGWIRRLRSR